LSRTAEEKPTDIERVIVFNVADEVYGMKVEDTSEVFTPDKVTSVPGAASSIAGVTNLRGDIVTVLDLANTVGAVRKEEDIKSHIIVVNQSGFQAGLLVGEIIGIMDIPVAEIDPPLNTIDSALSRFIRGEHTSEYGLIGILDAAALTEGQ
jgi:purine-binding chemotaxis protein CheW